MAITRTLLCTRDVREREAPGPSEHTAGREDTDKTSE